MTAEPKILENEPKPRLIQRRYFGRMIPMWEGIAKTSDIKGWAENPRITLARNKWHREFGREPDQDEIYEIMKSNEMEIKLKMLRDDIIRNGLREPVVLTHEGRLLDGNRRFFAIRFALDTPKIDHARRQDLEKVKVFVLAEDATQEAQKHILVQENFAPSLKKEWPDYVKALQIRDARDSGLSRDEIATHFGWNKSDVRQTLRTLEIIDDFLTFATDKPDPEDDYGGGLGLSETDAENEISARYQFFNEAQKRFFDELNKESDFKVHFFQWLHKGRFKSFPQVAIAHRAWRSEEAREILEDQEIDAGKDAKTVVDEEARTIKSEKTAIYQIRNFLKFLNTLGATDLANLPTGTRKELQKALKKSQEVLAMFDKMAGAASD